MLLLYLWSLGLVSLYAFVSPQLTEKMGRKVLIFGAIVWLTFFFFEVFAPFNLLGEPFLLVRYELLLEAIIALAFAWMVVTLYH